MLRPKAVRPGRAAERGPRIGELPLNKAVVAEAKTNLRSRATTKDMDQHCPWGFRSAHITAAKASTQGKSIKDLREEKPKFRAPELSTLRSSNPESSAKA